MSTILYTKNMQGQTRLCNNLRKIRFEHDEMSQAELAQKVNVSRQTIIAIEGADYSPSVELALRIAEIFSLPVEAIFYLKKKKGE